MSEEVFFDLADLVAAHGMVLLAFSDLSAQGDVRGAEFFAEFPQNGRGVVLAGFQTAAGVAQKPPFSS
ncbi:hypothetical protein SHKM778_94650 (plasmid) [Streptomyces sp. KM77-8]|uniref:Uncharacterized protein n=1 Tax=Streptomyces haneummycinicus TaxID=3074435 RepID=A0AAT9HZP5_9ACTN